MHRAAVEASFLVLASTPSSGKCGTHTMGFSLGCGVVRRSVKPPIDSDSALLMTIMVYM